MNNHLTFSLDVSPCSLTVGKRFGRARSLNFCTSSLNTGAAEYFKVGYCWGNDTLL